MDSDVNLNSLKKHIFYEFLKITGRVFIHVRYSDNVLLGNRGFTVEEKENGIILVLNSKMNFIWDEYGITVTLVFGTSPQKCFIPVGDIATVYSPELNAQFITAPSPVTSSDLKDKKEMPPRTAKDKAKDSETSENVIRVDFTKKNKK